MQLSQKWAGEERHKSSLCSQESHGVNTVVRGEEELQSGSDGWSYRTCCAEQTKQVRVREGLALAVGASQPGLGSSLGSSCHGHGFWAAKDLMASFWALRPQSSPHLP